MNTSAASTHDAIVQSFYLAFYGRPADPAGLAFWSQQVEAAGGRLADVTAAFARSEEALVRFGEAPLAARIADIYQAMFSRAPDADGCSTGSTSSARGTLRWPTSRSPSCKAPRAATWPWPRCAWRLRRCSRRGSRPPAAITRVSPRSRPDG
ncbi:DUF4214 domain-containing protein [Massilia arenae]|nr:DUF4214 domain-containing protein [Massilia arenae]